MSQISEADARKYEDLKKHYGIDEVLSAGTKAPVIRIKRIIDPEIRQLLHEYFEEKKKLGGENGNN